MYVWEQSEIVKTYRLTVAMVWALLGVGRVRPSTWAALMRRDLAEHATDDGYRLTPTGQDVADELHNLTAEPEDQTPDITTDDGPTFPECEDAGRTSSPRRQPTGPLLRSWTSVHSRPRDQ